MQEPASAIFSILNMLGHVLMLRRFACLVPRHAPLYWLWIAYSLVSSTGGPPTAASLRHV